MRQEFYHEIVESLGDWADHVVNTLRSIKRSTPTWVFAPLNYFLSLPYSCFEVYLSDEDRRSFADTVYKCLAHLQSIAQKGFIPFS
jgi:ABC-type dipeptide/oligopeptide/nickel transport system permease component